MDVASFSAQLEELQAQAVAAIAAAGSPAALDAIETAMLGRKGALKDLLGGIGQLPAEDRPKVGALANPVRSAIEAGFGKALTTILDANITTMIAAVFLFEFGTGPVQGFAVTLMIGILASIFTSIFVSRTIFELVLGKRRVERLSI